MIVFTDFYNDLEFMAALFYNNMLTNKDIKSITDKLIINENDSYLIEILVTNEYDEIKNLFEKYLIKKEIKIVDVNKVIIRKIFTYILSNKISISDGMDFIHDKIVLKIGSDVYIGDKIGIPGIIGDYDTLKDMINIYNSPEKEIKKAEKIIKQEMKEYIKNN